jgi:hypothetical protein
LQRGAFCSRRTGQRPRFYLRQRHQFPAVALPRQAGRVGCQRQGFGRLGFQNIGILPLEASADRIAPAVFIGNAAQPSSIVLVDHSLLRALANAHDGGMFSAQRLAISRQQARFAKMAGMAP